MLWAAALGNSGSSVGVSRGCPSSWDQGTAALTWESACSLVPVHYILQMGKFLKDGCVHDKK